MCDSYFHPRDMEKWGAVMMLVAVLVGSINYGRIGNREAQVKRSV